jgi:fructose-1,6-bisphosphatase II
MIIGEQIGNGKPPRVDVAVDPVEGTTLLAKGLPNAVSVVALSGWSKEYVIFPAGRRPRRW